MKERIIFITNGFLIILIFIVLTYGLYSMSNQFNEEIYLPYVNQNMNLKKF